MEMVVGDAVSFRHTEQDKIYNPGDTIELNELDELTRVYLIKGGYLTNQPSLGNWM